MSWDPQKKFNETKNPYVWPKNLLGVEGAYQFCTSSLGISPHSINHKLDSWIEEDQGSGDVSIWAHPNPRGLVEGYVVCKSPMLLCGVWLMAAAFFRCGAQEMAYNANEGQMIDSGQVILGVRGSLSSLLLAERVALNMCARLSGIATHTLKKIKELKNTNPLGPQLLETRKTTPGWRLLEKYATRLGGARNHRFGLDSGVMLKENHLRCSPLNGLDTINHVSQRAPLLLQTEVEVGNLGELELALKSPAQLIMLDNFNYEKGIEAVALKNRFSPEKLLEVSGNLEQWPIEKLANCGADFASMGSLIYKAIWSDISLQMFSQNGDV